MKIPVIVAFFIMVNTLCILAVWKSSTSIHNFDKRLHGMRKKQLEDMTTLKVDMGNMKKKIDDMETDSELHAALLYNMYKDPEIDESEYHEENQNIEESDPTKGS